jgi:hypothetical protein
MSTDAFGCGDGMVVTDGWVVDSVVVVEVGAAVVVVRIVVVVVVELAGPGRLSPEVSGVAVV